MQHLSLPTKLRDAAASNQSKLRKDRTRFAVLATATTTKYINKDDKDDNINELVSELKAVDLGKKIWSHDDIIQLQASSAHTDAFFIFYPKQFNNDPQKIPFTLLLLEGNASTWRDTELRKLPLKTEGTWEEFKAHFKLQWDEVNLEGVALNMIKRLKLTSSFKMDRLTPRFDELIPYCNLDGNHFMQIDRFVNTLPLEIQKHVLLQNHKTYGDARQAAVQYGIANDRIYISAGRKP
ncbi:hypothetical protein JOM56_014458 [Amanita muscaria]